MNSWILSLLGASKMRNFKFLYSTSDRVGKTIAAATYFRVFMASLV